MRNYQVIMEKVTRASGAYYSAHKDHLNQTTQNKNADAGPVVCSADLRALRKIIRGFSGSSCRENTADSVF
jgi:hypothetical protein